MKILLIHNFYQQRGGEDTVFNQETNLLKKDNEVQTITFHNQVGLKGAVQFLLSIWNYFEARNLNKIIKTFKPQVVHIHNLHFACGPLLIRLIKKKNIPIVYTLHNYRLICPSATLLHNGKIFTESLKSKFPWKAIKNKVYRQSFTKTFWLSFTIWFHKKIGTWKMVDKYIVLTINARDLLCASNLNIPSSKFVIKPNFITHLLSPISKRTDEFLYIGRLSEEKGIKVLLNSFKNSNHHLKIIGTGPLDNLVIEACKENNNIIWLGKLDKENVLKHLQNCTALIFPSIWFETFGLVIIEAFSLGIPVISSNIGSPLELVKHQENGLHFESGNSESLKDQLNYWKKLPEVEKNIISKNALQAYITHFTPENNLNQLLNIYHSLKLRLET